MIDSTDPMASNDALRSGSGERRTEVLTLLRGTDTPLSASDVARATGLHLNTARLHLDALTNQGLAERRRESRERPG